MRTRSDETRIAAALLRYVLQLAGELLRTRNPAVLPVLDALLTDARRLELDLAFSLTLLEAGL